MTSRFQLTVVSVAVLASMAQTKVPDSLELARELYNQQQFGEAIRLAEDARRTPALAQSASVVLARAYLERYRQTSEAADLDLAREALKTISATSLAPRDRVELLIAFGQSLYFDESYSLDDRFIAAAEQFEVALSQADIIDAAGRDRLFEWWAGALDRQAQLAGAPAHRALYDRILQRAERELARDPEALSASYWLAAAARGSGDVQRALGAAVAAWVRASALGTRGEALRTDVDSLMRQIILPERARELTPEGDARSTLSLLEAQWTAFKGRWEPTPKPAN
jgi:hypothetical protein